VKRTAASKRLRRSATAYRRLAWKAVRHGTSQQVDHYTRLADQLDRRAEREENRR
jgi:hypothetical protein